MELKLSLTVCLVLVYRVATVDSCSNPPDDCEDWECYLRPAPDVWPPLCDSKMSNFPCLESIRRRERGGNSIGQARRGYASTSKGCFPPWTTIKPQYPDWIPDDDSTWSEEAPPDGHLNRVMSKAFEQIGARYPRPIKRVVPISYRSKNDRGLKHLVKAKIFDVGGDVSDALVLISHFRSGRVQVCGVQPLESPVRVSVLASDTKTTEVIDDIQKIVDPLTEEIRAKIPGGFRRIISVAHATNFTNGLVDYVKPLAIAYKIRVIGNDGSISYAHLEISSSSRNNKLQLTKLNYPVDQFAPFAFP